LFDSSYENSVKTNQTEKKNLIPSQTTGITISKIDEEVVRDIKTVNPTLQIDQSGPAQKIPLSIEANVSKNIDLMGIASFNRVEPAVS
jgi:hypothetical protein